MNVITNLLRRAIIVFGLITSIHCRQERHFDYVDTWTCNDTPYAKVYFIDSFAASIVPLEPKYLSLHHCGLQKYTYTSFGSEIFVLRCLNCHSFYPDTRPLVAKYSYNDKDEWLQHVRQHVNVYPNKVLLDVTSKDAEYLLEYMKGHAGETIQ